MALRTLVSSPCTACDGGGEVEIGSYVTCNGTTVELTEYERSRAPLVRCPHCMGTGREPEKGVALVPGNEANAQLIAAAPELLEAAEKLVEQVSLYCADRLTDEVSMFGASEQLRAAVAKAKGGAA